MGTDSPHIIPPDVTGATGGPTGRRPRLLGGTLALVSLAIAMLATTAPSALAADRIYWANANGNEISSAKVNGSGGTDLDTTGATVSTPLGIAIDEDAKRIYWANQSANTISSAKLNGSGSGSDLPIAGATVSGPRGVAVDPDAGKIYWANATGNAISVANLDGSGGADLDTTGATLSAPAGVAIDTARGKIYWANATANKISVANLDGSGGGADLDTTGASVNGPLGVTIDPAANKIYWANAIGDSISVANLDGTGGGSDLDTTGATVSTPAGVAIDPAENKIYWASFGDKVSMANLDGTGGGSDLDTTGATVSGSNFPALREGPVAPTVDDTDPDSPANDNNPRVKGTVEPGSTVSLYATADCSGSPVASGSAAEFASPGFSVSVADDSTTAFRAIADFPDGSTSACSGSLTYVEDSTAPETQIDSGPQGPTNNAMPSFTFSSNEVDWYFECRIDSDPFAPCSGPGDGHSPAAGLADGQHTFEVRATDQAGNTDATPASRSFTVDTVVPTLTIDSGPSGPTGDPLPSFGFTAEAGAGVECSIDGGSPSYGACSDPASHTPATNLPDGDHSFRVRATDAAGNQTARTRDFTVDTKDPETQIDSGPQGATTNTRPSFGFSSDEGGSSFECRIDADPFAACSGPGDSHTPAADLDFGSHTFEVRATDQAGNLDPSPASRSFEVVPPPPALSINAGPEGPTNNPLPTFQFTAESGTTVECSIDGGNPDFGSCSDPSSHSPAAPLADDNHVFRVRATSAIGGQATETRDFTVDTQAPAAQINSGPQGLTDDPSPRFTFGAEPGASYQCRLDNQPFSPCSSPKSYPNLADGSHQFAVRATDAAGNTGPQAQRNFTVRTPEPDTSVDGSVSAKKTQKQKGKKIAIDVSVVAQEALTATADGKVKVGKKSYKLKPQSTQVGAGQSGKLKLKPKKSKDAKKIAKALKKGGKAKATLSAELRDGAGNTASQTLGVKLKR